MRNGTLDSALEPLLDRLYYTALDMTGNAADAEDVTQDAVLKAIRAHRTFVPGTDFRAWVFRILTNTVIDFYRRRRPPFAFAEPEAPRPAESESVEAALRSLEPEQKMAVILVDLHDFSMKEAAEMMGCPVGTVGSRLFRGREALRRRLAR